MNKNKKILAIDDSDTALLLMRYSLTDAGYEVHTFNNVRDALNFIHHTLPDLILLDLSMPDVSGFDFLNMRTELHIENIPILIISAYDSENSRKTALNLGAEDFIAKPIMIDLLLLKIKTYLGV